jgi:hypothetical protein
VNSSAIAAISTHAPIKLGVEYDTANNPSFDHYRRRPGYRSTRPTQDVEGTTTAKKRTFQSATSLTGRIETHRDLNRKPTLLQASGL